ncbi:Immunoglobulin-binding protein 1 [Daphnia magna]|uniref:Immunoglobulin-binding protein 1 n=1 Tax=Daphnia magna TaxID=35525 RepID=A0A164SJ89_9CRUS|nr:Immunoglobulin-binding protein 1 [Daphnia magna]
MKNEKPLNAIYQGLAKRENEFHNTNTTLRYVIITKNSEMADLDEGSETVSALFDKGLKIYYSLCDTMDPSNSPEYQTKVKMCIHILEDATRLVSALGLFSNNENVEEVATNDLKFFLLPVLLGDLNLKLNSDDRLNILNVAEVYFQDFLQRCKDYSVTGLDIPDRDELVKFEEPPRHPGPMGFEEMARQREEKIRKFREAKDLESKLVELKRALENPSSDESTTRDYYILLMKKFIFSTIEELKSISQEKPIVEHLMKIRKEGPDAKKLPPYVSKPLKPIIITRDAMQKAVYGLGYPSIPAMTVEELVDQRMKEGWYGKLAGSSGNARSLLDEAKNTEMAALQAEKEEFEKERKAERDEEEQLARARQFDDWKDDHRRGYGNRHNMG